VPAVTVALVENVGADNAGPFANTALPEPVVASPWIVETPVHCAICPFDGVPEDDTLPPLLGAAHVPSPRIKVELLGVPVIAATAVTLLNILPVVGSVTDVVPVAVIVTG